MKSINRLVNKLFNNAFFHYFLKNNLIIAFCVFNISSVEFFAQDPAIIPKTKDSLAVFLKTYPQKDTIFLRAIRPYALKLIYEDANYKKADSLANVQRVLSEKLNYGRVFISAI